MCVCVITYINILLLNVQWYIEANKLSKKEIINFIDNISCLNNN